MQLIYSPLTKNLCYTNKQAIEVKGLMIHSVGCAQPDPTSVWVKEEGQGWNTSDVQVCVHAFISASDGVVYQTLPWNYKAWHCGGDFNNSYIGVEMCESDAINYINGSEYGAATIEVTDSNKAQADAKKAYDAAVELFASLCVLYKLNPQSGETIVSHYIAGKEGKASDHLDPEHYWKQLGLSYTLEGFRDDIASYMK